MKAALLINPVAGRGKGKGVALAGLLSGIDIFKLESFTQLESLLRQIMAGDFDRLYISAGDGTVQAIQTWLAENSASLQKLQLCLLPHGTTNMTANDIGLKLRSSAAQADFITNNKPSKTVSRPTLRISNTADARVRHGMFLGAGAVAEAAFYSQNVFNDRGLHGNLAPFAVLTKAMAKTIFTAANPQDTQRFDRPFPLHITADGKTICEGQQLLALCTTLKKLILGSRPFWGAGDGAIKLSVFPYPVPNLLRWILPILYGGANRKMPQGARSASCHQLNITCPAHFVLDGEFFEAPSGQPIHVETGPLFTYVTA